MHEMRHFMRHQEIDPRTELADLALRLRRLGEQNDARMIEERERDAVRLRDRIADDDVGGLLRRESDLADNSIAHRLDPRRRPPWPARHSWPAEGGWRPDAAEPRSRTLKERSPAPRSSMHSCHGGAPTIFNFSYSSWRYHR